MYGLTPRIFITAVNAILTGFLAMCVPPRAVLDHGRSRVKFAMNAGAQVLPPSGEYDSSKWWESGVISDHVPRTRIDRPLKLSWEKSSPRPFLNSPIRGDVTTPLLLF